MKEEDLSDSEEGEGTSLGNKHQRKKMESDCLTRLWPDSMSVAINFK